MLHLIGKKALASKANRIAFAAFPALVTFIGFKESYETALNVFLFLSPYLYLVLSQDMAANEIESGMLENILFLKGGFRPYLMMKSFVLSLIGFAYTSLLFSVLVLYGIISNRFAWATCTPFLLGALVGSYYVQLGGLLSLFLRGGANVLLIIVAQAGVFIAALFSATQRTGFVAGLAKGDISGLTSSLKFLAVLAALPNLVLARRLFVYAIAVLCFLAAAFGVQFMVIRRLELTRK